MEVEDDGPGIREEARGQIFTPFFTTKPVGVGTGLGLHLSYNIVQHHGGSIDFQSRPGRTVFEVRLPLDGRTAEDHAPARGVRGGGGPVPGRRRRHDPLPTGTVTFLFTDVEGSTRLIQRLGAAHRPVLERQAALLREAVAGAGGVEVGERGDGFLFVFTRAPDAVRAAAAAQRALAAEPWPPEGTVRVRMGLHTGEGLLGGDNYMGLDVNRAARVAEAAHGGQVLLSETAAALARAAPPEGLALRDLGPHRLRDLPGPEPLFQLTIAGLPPPSRRRARSARRRCACRSRSPPSWAASGRCAPCSRRWPAPACSP